MKSPEQVLKEIRQLKEKLTPDLQKKVGKYSLEDKLIETYDSIKEAIEKNNISRQIQNNRNYAIYW